EARHRAWQSAHTLRSEREAIVAEAEALAESTPPAKGKTWRALERRWHAATDAGPSDDDLEAMQVRFAAAGERLQRRRHELEEHREEAQAENLARLTALQARLVQPT